MFTSFIIGITALSALVLLVLLVQPRPGHDVPPRTVPLVALVATGLLAALGWMAALS